MEIRAETARIRGEGLVNEPGECVISDCTKELTEAALLRANAGAWLLQHARPATIHQLLQDNLESDGPQEDSAMLEGILEQLGFPCATEAR